MATLNPSSRQCRPAADLLYGDASPQRSLCLDLGRAIDPARHFVVSVNLFGNGYSSSPSNTAPPQDGPRFPHVTLFDNVACQHRLLTEGLGVRRIALYSAGRWRPCRPFSGQLNIPVMVDAILPYCGAARCSPINYAFLDGPKAALQADAAWNEGDYSTPPEKGLRAFGRVYVAWAYSHASSAMGSIASLASPRSRILCAIGRRII